MDFGMPTLIENSSLSDACGLCRSLELDFVEINMNFPSYQLSLLDAETLCSLKREYGVYFTIHLAEELDLCGFNDAVRKAWLKTALDALSLAKEIDAPIVNIHLPKGIYVTLPDRKEYLYKTYFSNYMANMCEFADAAEALLKSSETRVCIENTDGFLPFQKSAIDECLKRDCFALTLDIGHSACAGHIDKVFIDERREKLKHMRIHDAQDTHCHMALGTGTLDIGEYLLLARKCGCRCVLETKTIDALTTSVPLAKTY